MNDWYLNGTKLCPLNLTYEESFRISGGDSELLSGGLRRDIRARKRDTALSWEFLPETFDGTYHCYADLEALGTRSGTVTLIRPIGTSTGTTQYRVLCDMPSGELAHRDAGTVFWNVSMNLREA